jgi:hypothetical protein
VLPARSLEYFLSTQHWLDAFPPPHTPHYARLSTHITGLLNATTGTRAAYVPKPIPLDSVALHSGGTGSFAFNLAELESLERQLAYHVGPVARHLVKRAAAKAVSHDELMRLLAAEVDSIPARQQFIDACRPMVQR